MLTPVRRRLFLLMFLIPSLLAVASCQVAGQKSREPAVTAKDRGERVAGAEESEIDLDPYLLLARPEPLYWLPSAGYACEDVLYALLSWHDPGALPDHEIYQDLPPKVRSALLQLNSWYRDDLLLQEESPVFLRERDGSRVRIRSSGEGGGWVWSRRERLEALGVEVRWNSRKALYEVAR
tara:strand:+ start:561 stop:1100 length:540 start_codon:yes stop_codon:yes gene_type:complete